MLLSRRIHSVAVLGKPLALRFQVCKNGESSEPLVGPIFVGTELESETVKRHALSYVHQIQIQPRYICGMLVPLYMNLLRSRERGTFQHTISLSRRIAGPQSCPTYVLQLVHVGKLIRPSIHRVQVQQVGQPCYAWADTHTSRVGKLESPSTNISQPMDRLMAESRSVALSTHYLTACWTSIYSSNACKLVPPPF